MARSRNLEAFLHVIREGETNQTPNAYRMLNGGGYFDSFADHPYAGQSAPPGKAAGAPQFIPHTWQDVCRRLIGPGDFSPDRQDAGAAALAIDRGAGPSIEAGDIAEAMRILSPTWVSFRTLNLDRAKRVFTEWGGVLADSVRHIETPPAAAPVTTGGPMGIALPLLAQLLPQVFQLFSGRAQAQIAKATGADPATAGAFMQSMITQIGNAVGVPVTDSASAVQAVAAVHALPEEKKTETVAALEKYSLDQLAPIFDKLHEIDKDKWSAQVTGMDAAAARARAEPWDMTRWLVWFAGGTATVLVLGLAAALIYQAVWKDDINTALVGLAGPLLAISMGVWREVFAYRFDGNKESAAQTAIIGELSRK